MYYYTTTTFYEQQRGSPVYGICISNQVDSVLMRSVDKL